MNAVFCGIEVALLVLACVLGSLLAISALLWVGGFREGK